MTRCLRRLQLCICSCTVCARVSEFSIQLLNSETEFERRDRNSPGRRGRVSMDRGSSRKIPTSLPGRSTRQTVSTRVHSLSTRSREPFRTSLDLTDTYGTPGDISILFLVGRRHGANHAMFEASALHRATMPSHATYRSVESARSRHGSMPQACTTLA